MGIKKLMTLSAGPKPKSKFKYILKEIIERYVVLRVYFMKSYV